MKNMTATCRIGWLRTQFCFTLNTQITVFQEKKLHFWQFAILLPVHFEHLGIPNPPQLPVPPSTHPHAAKLPHILQSVPRASFTGIHQSQEPDWSKLGLPISRTSGYFWPPTPPMNNPLQRTNPPFYLPLPPPQITFLSPGTSKCQ